MIGSLIKTLAVKDPNDLTIISTDCDMFVIGYGYMIQNMEEIVDTVRFFELFGITTREEVCGVPEALGCDYTKASHTIYDLARLKFDYQSLVYKVFYQPELGEDCMTLTSSLPTWEKQLSDVFLREEEELMDIDEMGEEQQEAE